MDHREINEKLLNRLIDDIKSYFPITRGKLTVNIENVRAEYNPDKLDDYEYQKKIKIHKRNLLVPIKATVKVTDGKRISKKDIVIAEVPVMTNRTTFIIGGKEYILKNQVRRKPGIYVLKKREGGEIQFNSAARANFKIIVDHKGIFRIQYQSRTVLLYPILKALGVDDHLIRMAMGKYYDINREYIGDDPHRIASQVFKLYTIQTRKEASDIREAINGIKKYWSEYSFDPAVNKITIGRPDSNINVNTLLTATKKVRLAIEGKELPTNANDLKFKSFHSPIDTLSERITMREVKRTITNKIARTLFKRNILKHPELAVNKNFFKIPLINTFKETGLQHLPDQINPVEDLVASYQVTPTGVGGYEGSYMPDEARELEDTHFGLIDPVTTPSSEKVGLALSFTNIVNPLDHTITVLTPEGKRKTISITEFLHSNVTTPDQYKKKKKQILARSAEGPIKFVDKKKIKYIVPGLGLLANSSILIPFLNKNHGARMQMSAKQIAQAVPLKDPDVPYIQTTMEYGPKKITVPAVEVLGSKISPISPVDGVVEKVKETEIIIKGKDGKKHSVKLPKNFFLNSDSLLTTREVFVKPGDKVKKNQVLANTNFTKTKSGYLSLGKHLRVAYLPYYGYTTKDGVVISESAAKKLASEHVYREELEIQPGAIVNKQKFQIYYPTKYNKKQLDKLDKEGVVKKGQIVELNDPIILYMVREEPDPDEKILGKLSRKALKEYKDRSILWSRNVPGEVIDVYKTKNRINVIIKTVEPAVIGDKVSGFYGNKGVITNIVPDSLMPHTKDGTPVEVLISPLAVISRMNMGQLYDAAISKIAKKLNTTIYTTPFDEIDPEKVQKALKKYGLEEREELFDPKTGRSLGKVTVGYPYFLKLKQRVEKGLFGRGAYHGVQYSAIASIAKHGGGKTGAKAMDLLTQYALLGYGAMDNLLEMHAYKSEKNEPFWDAIRKGFPIPPPRETEAFKRFKGFLNILGVDLKRKDNTVLLTFLDKDEIKKISNGELTRPYLILRGKDGMPEKGGLFDINLTGGLKGDKFSHFTLVEPIPNPFFENAIISLTGLKPEQYKKIIAGKLGVDKTGKLVEKDYVIGGPKLIKRLLADIDIEKELARAYKEARTATGTQLNKLRDKIGYLKALKETGKRPEDVYFTDIIPVIPPKMRPIILPKDKKSVNYDDINLYYRFLGKTNDSIKKAKKLNIPERKKNELLGELYNTLAHLEGIVEPTMGRGRPHRGVLIQLAGTQPKKGYIQSFLFSKTQDFSGRAVLSQDLGLDIDKAYIPREMAWEIYSPFILRELTRSHGKTMIEALRELEARSPLAAKALEVVVKERPLLFNRDPSLHRHNIIALDPELTSDKTIKLHPLVFNGLGADVDGDSINVFLPTTPEAVREARKMYPSMNAIKYGYNYVIVAPEEDAAIGLWELSKKPEGKTIVYKTEKDVIDDLKAMKIKPYQRVKIGNKIYSAGQIYLISQMPSKWKDVIQKYFPFNAKNINAFLKEVYLSGNPIEFKKILKIINDAGEEYAYKSGITISIEEITPSKSTRNQLKKNLYLHGKQAAKEVEKLMKRAEQEIRKKKSAVFDMIESGARGSKRNIQEIAMFVGDVEHPYLGKITEKIKHSYNEGLNPMEYWSSLYGARRGLIASQTEVKDPGEVAKETMSGMLDVLIDEHDQGDRGLLMDINDDDIIGRFTARAIKKNNKIIIPANTLITDRVIEKLKKNKIKQIFVRSPITTLNPITIPVKSFGLKDDGKLPEPNDNIGVLATHALTEPLTQLALKKKHIGVETPAFEKIKSLLELPANSVFYAIHSPYSGKITDIIHKRGYYIVMINNKPVEIPGNKKLIVKVGDKIEAGDKLTEGLSNYHEIIATKGLDKTKVQYVKELKDIYHKEAGLPIGQRWLEVIAKRVTDNAIVEDPGIFSDLYIPGDIIPASLANELSKKTNLDTIITPYHAGLKLAEDVGKYKKGTVIDETNIKDLKGKRAKLTSDFKWRPTIIGLKDVASTTSDWLTSMLTGRIKSQLQEYGAKNATINLKTVKSPFPKLIMAGWNV